MNSMETKKKAIPLPTLRTLVQTGFAMLCLVAGWRFYHFYHCATGKTDVFIARPPSVEGFLPISALLGFKRFVLTGRWDDVHPSGLTIFMAAPVIALLFQKGFCGWICPVGFVSNVVEKAGKKCSFPNACRSGWTIRCFVSNMRYWLFLSMSSFGKWTSGL